MAAKQFEITKITNGEFGICIKLHRGFETKINDVFGTRTKKVSETYYKWVNEGLNEALAVGNVITLDPDDYIIRKKDCPHPVTGEIIELSYLIDRVEAE
jgi:hypothetical protein